MGKCIITSNCQTDSGYNLITINKQVPIQVPYLFDNTTEWENRVSFITIISSCKIAFRYIVLTTPWMCLPPE